MNKSMPIQDFPCDADCEYRDDSGQAPVCKAGMEGGLRLFQENGGWMRSWACRKPRPEVPSKS